MAGDGQRAIAGEPVPQPLVVRAVDRSDRPVTGVEVTFRFINTNGRVAPGTVATGVDGQATAEVTLGGSVGAQVVEARLVNPQGLAVEFELTALQRETPEGGGGGGGGNGDDGGGNGNGGNGNGGNGSVAVAATGGMADRVTGTMGGVSAVGVAVVAGAVDGGSGGGRRWRRRRRGRWRRRPRRTTADTVTTTTTETVTATAGITGGTTEPDRVGVDQTGIDVLS